MPFTQDSSLNLLFTPDLVPTSVRSALVTDLHIRPLARDDYKRGHLEVLKVLSKVTDVGLTAYQAHFDSMKSSDPKEQAYYVISIVSKETDQVVATGTVFVEKKFIRGLGKVGHIEDIAVSKSMQGKKLGLRVINCLTAISESVGCYKTILDCSDDNIPFYEKCGYSKKENQMVRYAVDSQVSAKL